MCRWVGWTGAPVFLEDIVSRPGHSLIDQSRAAAECKTAINADGFGLAWYGERPEPGIFRDVYPAWSDPNLRSLTAQVRSHLFLAHVRASTGTATSRNNCHPFVVGRWSFMHNGQVGGFDAFRRAADMEIPDDLYPHRKGATDSEVLFLMALADGLDRDPAGAMARAASRLEIMSRERGTTPHLRLTAAFSDGVDLYAVRHASDEHAPTLYYRQDPDLGGVAVASEPYETDSGWTEVPSGSFCRFGKDGIEINAFPAESSAKAA